MVTMVVRTALTLLSIGSDRNYRGLPRGKTRLEPIGPLIIYGAQRRAGRPQSPQPLVWQKAVVQSLPSRRVSRPGCFFVGSEVASAVNLKLASLRSSICEASGAKSDVTRRPYTPLMRCLHCWAMPATCDIIISMLIMYWL